MVLDYISRLHASWYKTFRALRPTHTRYKYHALQIVIGSKLQPKHYFFNTLMQRSIVDIEKRILFDYEYDYFGYV